MKFTSREPDLIKKNQKLNETPKNGYDTFTDNLY